LVMSCLILLICQLSDYNLAQIMWKEYFQLDFAKDINQARIPSKFQK
jgi:hypothetical protein